MRNSMNGAIETATRNRNQRANYRATHLDNNPNHSAFERWARTNLNVAGGHVMDRVEDAGDWIRGDADRYAEENRIYDLMNRYRSTVESTSDEIRDRSGANNGLYQEFINRYTSTVEDQIASERIAALRQTAAFQNMNQQLQQQAIQNERNIARNQIPGRLNELFGGAQNMDQVRQRVQRLQGTTFQAGMTVDGQTFNNAEDWDRYVANATHALSDFERESSTIIRRAIVDMNSEDAQARNDARRVGQLLDISDASGNITASGGIRDRIETISGASTSFDQVISENQHLIQEHLPNLNGRTGFRRMDDSGHEITRRRAEINVETEARERRRAGAGGNNNGN